MGSCYTSDKRTGSTFLKDSQAKRRIMSARAAYRDKASGTVPSLSSGLSADVNDVQAKCRVVMRGFSDPHLAYLDRQFPVALRTSLHVLLQYAASMLSEGWLIGVADIAIAFLQGSSSSKRPRTTVDATSSRSTISSGRYISS